MSADSILLTDPARVAIVAAARSVWPREMIGLVGGTGNTVTAFHPLPNVASAGDRFAVAPAAFTAGVAAIERRGRAFLGFVHSHPNGSAALSSIDRRELWRDCLQFVIGLDRSGPHELTCFALAGDTVRRLDIRDPLTADGFAIHEHVFGSDEMIELGSALEPALASGRAGARHLLGDPRVRAVAHDPRLLTIAAAALGPAAIPFRATLFRKTPVANWLVAWHQDTALPFCERRAVLGYGPWSIKAGVPYAHAPTEALEQVLALRLHLDDCRADNGALRLLPGSHRLGVLDDDAVARYARGATATVCEVGRGGVLAMRPLVIHSSSKATAATPRRVLHLEYASSLRTGGGLQLATT